jgi:hypothetical protein
VQGLRGTGRRTPSNAATDCSGPRPGLCKGHARGRGESRAHPATLPLHARALTVPARPAGTYPLQRLRSRGTCLPSPPPTCLLFLLSLLLLYLKGTILAHLSSQGVMVGGETGGGQSRGGLQQTQATRSTSRMSKHGEMPCVWCVVYVCVCVAQCTHWTLRFNIRHAPGGEACSNCSRSWRRR